MESIRESVIAGSWYPGNPDTLKREVQKYLDQAQVVTFEGELAGLIVPHAGYLYSGAVAAHAYALLRGRSFSRVLIIAPSHRAHFSGATVSRVAGYRTPLGIVPVAQDLVEELLHYSDTIRDLPHADAQEHSLEIQLPFLQVTLGRFELIPVTMGDQSYASSEHLAHAIAETCRGKDVLLVASSDLSHYHPYAEAKRLDQLILDDVAAFDPESLSRHIARGESEACGAGPMATMMLATKALGANRAQVLHYANSGDVTGDTRGVVGYMAAAMVTASPAAGEEAGGHGRHRAGVDLGLSEEEKATLKALAHEAIRSRCFGRPMPPLPPPTPKLEEHRGAFVCLHTGEELRGCIGMIEGKAPLVETVREMAVQAAFADPRFCALQADELEHIDLEISVLTPLQRIQDLSRIEIGKHGLVIRRGYRSGLLLPQVAVEHGWDRTQFLEWTCHKAGLPGHAWESPDTEVYVFSADVF